MSGQPPVDFALLEETYLRVTRSGTAHPRIIYILSDEGSSMIDKQKIQDLADAALAGPLNHSAHLLITEHIPLMLARITELEGKQAPKDEGWQDLESSLLAAYKYDGESLTLKFKTNGDIWRYWPVHPATFQDFMLAKSKGGFFIAHIRDAMHSEKIQ